MLLPAVTPSLAQFQFVVLEAPPPWPANENTARKPLSLYTEAAKKTIHLILISHLQPPVVTLPSRLNSALAAQREPLEGLHNWPTA